MNLANMESPHIANSAEYKFRSVSYHLHQPIHWAHNKVEEYQIPADVFRNYPSPF